MHNLQMLTESDVIASVCRFLKRRNFQITKFCRETEHGKDILALAPDGKRQVTVEAKGETSSKRHTSRYGKPFNNGQVEDHVSRAVYCALRDRSNRFTT